MTDSLTSSYVNSVSSMVDITNPSVLLWTSSSQGVHEIRFFLFSFYLTAPLSSIVSGVLLALTFQVSPWYSSHLCTHCIPWWSCLVPCLWTLSMSHRPTALYSNHDVSPEFQLQKHWPSQNHSFSKSSLPLFNKHWVSIMCLTLFKHKE